MYNSFLFEFITFTVMEEKNNGIIKVAAAFIVIAFLVLMVYFGSDIIFPLLMALLFAVLLRPVVHFFNTKLHFPHIIAIGFTLLIAISVIAALILFMSAQVSEFMTDLPEIKRNLNEHIVKIQRWVSQTFGLSYSEQETYLENTVSNSNVISTSSFSSLTNVLLYIVLIPIYTFLILTYRSLLLGFLLKLVPKKDIASLQEILIKIKSVIRSYIVGLLIEVIIVAFLTSLGLWIVGVDYFIFLGVMTAFLNLIPYIGIIVACTISAFIALVGSSDPTIMIGVVVVNVIVQFIDNNILIPKVVGSKVSINALTSMVGVIVGGSLAGISGMFLAIPVIAIIKVIFDHTPSMQAYGYVMGDEIPKSFNWTKIRLPYFSYGTEKASGNKENENKPEEEKEN